jgi:DNA-binding IclR family transcriptional regulator
MIKNTPKAGTPKRALPVKSAKRVLEVLELLTSRPQSVALHEIAAAVGMPQSSAHRLMSTLVEAGFVQQKDKRYELSMKWFDLMTAMLASAGRLNSSNLRQTAYPVMLQLSADLEMTCNLAVLHGRNVVYIEKVDGGRFGQIGTHVGAMLPAHATALGKSLLAGLSPERREGWLDVGPYSALTSNTLTAVGDLRAELEKTRQRGYAIDDEEFHLGIVCLASAISGDSGDPVGAVSVSAVKPSILGLGFDVVGSRIREGAERIAARLGTPYDNSGSRGVSDGG